MKVVPLDEIVYLKKELLRPLDRKNRNDQCTVVFGCVFDQLAQCVLAFFDPFVIAVAVNRLHQKIRRSGDRFRVVKERRWRVAKIAGHDERRTVESKKHHRGAQHVSRITEFTSKVWCKRKRGMVISALP